MWVGAFLQRQRGAITRVYNIDAYFWRGEWVEMTLDASPWGFGTTLRVNGVYISWYTDAIIEQDAERFNTSIGSCEGQQTWESLNILIALRTWKTWWSRLQICLQVKADNITALSLLCRLKGSSTALNIIARELALEFGDGSFFPLQR